MTETNPSFFVKFKNPNGCTCNCDYGVHGLPLKKDGQYQVVAESNEFYNFMGWGSMKFKSSCFIRVDTDTE